jgi:hypothetical protein
MYLRIYMLTRWGLPRDMESGILIAGASILEELTHEKAKTSDSQMPHISLDRLSACRAVRSAWNAEIKQTATTGTPAPLVVVVSAATPLPSCAVERINTGHHCGIYTCTASTRKNFVVCHALVSNDVPSRC